MYELARSVTNWPRWQQKFSCGGHEALPEADNRVVVLSLPLWSALPTDEDEQSLLPLGYTQPSQTSECTAAWTAESTLTRLPGSSGLRTSCQTAGSRSSSSASHRGSERPTAARCAPRQQRPPQQPPRSLSHSCTAITCARSLAQLVYYIQPKSAHSTIHNHLLAAGAFEGAMERWDAAHPTVLNKPMHVYGRSTEASKALAQLMEGANPPLEWTVVRSLSGTSLPALTRSSTTAGRTSCSAATSTTAARRGTRPSKPIGRRTSARRRCCPIWSRSEARPSTSSRSSTSSRRPWGSCTRAAAASSG